MTESNAIELVGDAISNQGETWADLGAGTGTFSMALAKLLGASGTVYAVERDARALEQLQRYNRRQADRSTSYATVVAIKADFTTLTGLTSLDGILIANALHFVPKHKQPALLTSLAMLLKPTGRIVLVEYDRDQAHAYNPFPISAMTLPEIAAEAGLAKPMVHARRPSAFGGELYSASILK